MKEQKIIPKAETSKRVSMRFYLKADDCLKIEELMQTLSEVEAGRKKK